MKKFLYEHKSYKVRSGTEIPIEKLKRERITLTSRRTISPSREDQPSHSDTNIGTIRTEEYKKDLAEFQARRSSGQQEPESQKKKCRHSLSGCTDCAADPDRTFNYEKRSGTKYKKKRERSASEDVPNIQFLFQNQVFMPGNMLAQATYSEPYKPRRRRSEPRQRELAQKHIDFKEDSPPLVYKNNSLPFDVRNFVSSPSEEEVDGVPRVSSSSSKDDCSGDRLLEVMSELRSFDQWADEQLKIQSPNCSKLEDCKSDTSSLGLPLVSSSDVDVAAEQGAAWSRGRWGAIPVQVRRLPGVAVQQVGRHAELNILRKCRHPNIILLMGLFPDARGDVHLVCERCDHSLHDVVHVQGRVLSAQTSVQYACDAADALVFLRMRGYVHTALNSHGIVVTSRDAAKLADLGSCVPVEGRKTRGRVDPTTRYENIGEARGTFPQDCEPLLSARSSEEEPDSVTRDVTEYASSPHYRWLAPELFSDEAGRVRACERTAVYSLALVLWECCNASVPWKSLTYEKLKELYTLWQTGIRLPADGTYPGGLLALLQGGLQLARGGRPALGAFAGRLHDVKQSLEKMEYIVIPARLTKKQSDFSSVWAAASARDSSGSDTESNAVYETLEKPTYATVDKCCLSEDETDRRPTVYDKLTDNNYSSACSTPISKIRARIKDLGTPIALHRSDSTEYCSIRSPDSRNFGKSDGNNNTTTSAKFSRSFTPQSYKPLHIKVPEFNFDSFRGLPKDESSEKSSYNFDIKNYSLPNTPIARSNKLRKNAWLSGDLVAERNQIEEETPEKDDINQFQSAPDTPEVSTYSSVEKDNDVFSNKTYDEERSPDIVDIRDHQSVTFQSPQPAVSARAASPGRPRSWSPRAPPAPRPARPARPAAELCAVQVRPLVAIHERWIYEANRRGGRAASLPDHSFSSTAPAVKPASHVVDPWQKSLPQLNVKRGKYYKPPLQGGRNGAPSEQFCQARDNIARCVAFARDQEGAPWQRDTSKSTTRSQHTLTPPPPPPPTPAQVTKVDQTTDTNSIEDFIRDIIRKEIQTLIQAELDDHSDKTSRSEELLNKGVSNVMDALNVPDDKIRFSRVRINGNNKPLLQITFSRNGENNLQVMDNCVNVTFCDKGVGEKVSLSLDGRDKMDLSVESHKLNGSMDEPQTPEDNQHSLKRCQTFNSLQEARSTEDLYIDDDLSGQLQESFGRLVAPHELHELLCEREDGCCLLQVRQENGGDAVYFRRDGSDESRDAPDGRADTVVYKRSISLIEERIERVPRPSPVLKRRVEARRPKSEVFQQNLNRDTRVLSSSSPSLSTIRDEVELNIENIMSYQDSSSDECLKCQADDDFETLEKEIEEELAGDLAKSLGKISEENLSVINEESSGRETGSDEEGRKYKSL